MRAAIYLRVSTDEQTTDNQERELRATAERAGHEVVAMYRDAGISGAKGRDKRPGFDAMHKDAARRRFDVVMAWSVDRLGRSLQDLIAFMQELRSLKIDLFLHQHDVSGAWLVRGIRAGHDPGAGECWHRAGQGCGQALWSAAAGA
jgi:DNA invertase Pin-like site-specific DNA recombinase